jgi:hypothetical protein
LDLDTGVMDFVQTKLIVDETNVWVPNMIVDENGEQVEEPKVEGDERPKYNEEKHIWLNDAKLTNSKTSCHAKIA